MLKQVHFRRKSGFSGYNAQAESANLGFDKIAKRGVELAKKHGIKGYDYMSRNMDITACHANGNPLQLLNLLTADDFNFAHDVFGISRHIDRDTGELTGHFSPRFSKQSD